MGGGGEVGGSAGAHRNGQRLGRCDLHFNVLRWRNAQRGERERERERDREREREGELTCRSLVSISRRRKSPRSDQAIGTTAPPPPLTQAGLTAGGAWLGEAKAVCSALSRRSTLRVMTRQAA